VARQIANAHMAFNVLGVAVLVGFTPQIAHVFERSVSGDVGSGLRSSTREMADVPS
jgi:hypothetical protein